MEESTGELKTKIVKISEIPERKMVDDYTEDTIFVFEDKPIRRDPVTGLAIKE